MALFFIIVLSTYVLAINFYAFILMLLQKRQTAQSVAPRRKISDGKILLSGTLGGALGVFLSTFFLKYRRDSILIMVLMPIITAIYVYLILKLFSLGFFYR